ncbi:MAG: class II glutamine amidotransferase [Candidatus Actinomarinaceae bacterium]
MCLAILQKQGASKISDAQITNAFKNNNDGCGISYIYQNQIKVHKIMNINECVSIYNQIHKNHSKTSNIMLHFRIGTHGVNSKYNVHPFWVNNDLIFCHNGIINNVDNCNKRSDTRVFNDVVLKSLPNRFIHNASIIKMMSDFIGHSKLIFLNSNNQFKIVNEKMGHWIGKTWFSNSSYKPNKFDFGGYSSRANFNQCNFNFDDDDGVEYVAPKIKLKQTRYINRKCEKCSQLVSKQHYHSDTHNWVCGVCLNVLNNN